MKSIRNIKVRKRKSGQFEIRYMKNNRQHSIYGSTIFSCRQKYAKVIEHTKEQPKSKTMLFITWYEKYISIYKKSCLKKNTLKNLNGLFRLHILPYIAQRPLKRITSQDIQEIINRMSKIPRQATITYTQLNACLEQAYKLNLISHNPCYAVIINKDKGGKGKALTKEQEEILLTYLKKHNPPIKILIFLYLATGMRRSELLNIEQRDLDFKNNEIVVRGEKTKNSYRTIQVKSQVLRLFPDKEKPFKEWTPSKVNHTFKTITKKLHFNGITIHSLRHTFATRCIEQGIDMVVVQKWLGHASITMTIDTYTHIEKDFKQQSANKLEYDFIP
ncbi:MAG: site-specific integrase [Clostridia bacterium]|nr:site-specific integrase [Clostridia bacterium]